MTFTLCVTHDLLAIEASVLRYLAGAGLPDSVPRPRQFDGARSSVEPFLHQHFGIQLDETWRWLVKAGELVEFPALTYDPIADATNHMVAHHPHGCANCALWGMLVVLWSVQRELCNLEDHQEALRLGNRALRILLELRGSIKALEPQQGEPATENPTGALASSVDEATRQLELFTDDENPRLSEDARAALRGPAYLLTRCCRLLRGAGFSYGDIAKLIGDRTKGARDRIRMRCKTKKQESESS